MVVLGSSLGLGLDPTATLLPNHAPAYLCFHFVFAYGLLSSQTLKQWYGTDHNESPRHDLDKYGAEAVRSGKITQR